MCGCGRGGVRLPGLRSARRITREITQDAADGLVDGDADDAFFLVDPGRVACELALLLGGDLLVCLQGHPRALLLHQRGLVADQSVHPESHRQRSECADRHQRTEGGRVDLV
jgi:hypothetical protein